MFDQTLNATHFDGRTEIRHGNTVLHAGCAPGEAGASALLLAALAACIGASLEPLLARHGLRERLHIAISADETIRVTIILPSAARPLLSRCERAAERCPVRRALAVPVAFDWKFEEPWKNPA